MKKILIFAVIIVVIGGIAWYFMKKKKGTNPSDLPVDTTSSNGYLGDLQDQYYKDVASVLLRFRKAEVEAVLAKAEYKGKTLQEAAEGLAKYYIYLAWKEGVDSKKTPTLTLSGKKFF